VFVIFDVELAFVYPVAAVFREWVARGQGAFALGEIVVFIGILTNVIDERIQSLRKGRSMVIESDHTLIIGWSPQVFTIISELVEANASRKLVSVCSEYKYWGTLVTEVEPAARPVAAFDITEAERLLVRALEESGVETMTAGGLKSKMLALDPAFDEHNYGARSFRAFLAMLPKRVEIAEAGGPDEADTPVDTLKQSSRARGPCRQLPAKRDQQIQLGSG